MSVPSRVKNLVDWVLRTYQMNISKRPDISGQNKYFELQILNRSQHNFVLIYLFVNTGKSKIVNK